MKITKLKQTYKLGCGRGIGISPETPGLLEMLEKVIDPAGSVYQGDPEKKSLKEGDVFAPEVLTDEEDTYSAVFAIETGSRLVAVSGSGFGTPGRWIKESLTPEYNLRTYPGFPIPFRYRISPLEGTPEDTSTVEWEYRKEFRIWREDWESREGTKMSPTDYYRLSVEIGPGLMTLEAVFGKYGFLKDQGLDDQGKEVLLAVLSKDLVTAGKG